MDPTLRGFPYIPPQHRRGGGGGGFGFVFGVRFVVGVPQKEGGHAGSGESGGLQPAAALGGRRHQPPRELQETLGKHSVITGEKS